MAGPRKGTLLIDGRPVNARLEGRIIRGIGVADRLGHASDRERAVMELDGGDARAVVLHGVCSRRRREKGYASWLR